jgi:hypothetical protein
MNIGDRPQAERVHNAAGLDFLSWWDQHFRANRGKASSELYEPGESKLARFKPSFLPSPRQFTARRFTHYRDYGRYKTHSLKGLLADLEPSGSLTATHLT